MGTTDGWQDLAHDFRMDWEFDCATDGNIALTGEIDLRRGREFVLALAFGESLHHALVNGSQSLGTPFADHRARFVEQWQRARDHLLPDKEKSAEDGGHLYHVSHSLLLAHEDKRYDGAMIASLSIPWGESKAAKTWAATTWSGRATCATAPPACSRPADTAVPLRALIYLACTQREDGGFYQNFWINGEPYWRGVQLDETAFPILLAWRLHEAKALQDFDPYPMVLRAAGYLIHNGPATPQERWEENSGYSPSTLAAHIAALICAAAFARERGQAATAQYLEEYADFLESHIEPWTVTTEGSLVPGIRRHFIRIHPVDVDDPQPDEDANRGILELRNQPPGEPHRVPGQGYRGCRVPGVGPLRHPRAGDPADRGFAPRGGRGAQGGHALRPLLAAVQPRRLWAAGRRRPLPGLGERARLAAADRRARALRAGRRPGLAAVTSGRWRVSRPRSRLLPEQVWSDPDRPDAHMHFGRPTGGADAAAVGPRRVPQAGALGRRRPGLRPDPGGRRPLPQTPVGGADGDLEIQPAGARACRPGGPCGSRRRPVPAALDGNEWAAGRRYAFNAHGLEAINSWTSTCHRSSGLRSASPSSGRPRGTGKGGISRSALAVLGRPEGDGSSRRVVPRWPGPPASLNRSGRSPRSPGGRADPAGEVIRAFVSETGVDRTIKATALSGPGGSEYRWSAPLLECAP